MSGIERPDAADLLETARSVLLDEIVPSLAGPARYKALMIANAMAIAGRAAQAAPLAELADAASICAAIRAGRCDDDDAVFERLLAYAEARCRVSSKAP